MPLLDTIPFAMAMSANERLGVKYKCTRQAIQGQNQLGWKVAHIEDVGLGYTGAVETTSLSELCAHMKRFLSPENMFLVPKAYAVVAETPDQSGPWPPRNRHQAGREYSRS
jgi:hypothetical protein